MPFLRISHKCLEGWFLVGPLVFLPFFPSVAAELPDDGLKINFSDLQTPAPAGFFTDAGEPYSPGRADGTQVFGWVDRTTGAASDITSFARNRLPNPDLDTIRETLVHMDHPQFNGNDREFRVELPNGEYRLLVQVGDVDSEATAGVLHQVNAEGMNLVSFPVGVGEYGVKNATGIVTVSDGILNIDQQGGNNTKIHLLIIEEVNKLNTPAVLGSTPADGATGISLDTTISANFLHLPNAASNGATSINNDTISTDTVQLFGLIDGGWVAISGSVNGTGGGDAINFTPSIPLSENTQYRYVVDGVEDLAGQALLPFSMEFTTGEDAGSNAGFAGVAFEKVGPLVSGRNYTSLTMGPDNRLYGLSVIGNVDRWDINGDGTLDNQQTITTLSSAFGGPRLAIGFVFDPDSTPTNLIAYVTHSTFTFSGGPAYDGEISMLSGSSLQDHQHLITGLPRSVRDHLTNSVAFRPGEPDVLYFLQGSNSAGGEADGPWGNRPERLLTAALLRLDLNKLPDNLPLNVRTSDDQSVINAADIDSAVTSDGYYNPYYTNAPLTLYATGIRNAYDLVWHSNGQAYVPTNGTAGGSNSPASVQGTRRPDGTFYNGQAVPFVSGNSTQRDFLFRINPAQPLGYYGHPNPLRGEYVLNRASEDTNTYPSTITPDANYRGFAFDFEFNKSPNGVVEYKSDAHNGALQGALLVARYSGGSDIIALRPNGASGDIGESAIGLEGMSGFVDPLELTEDTRNGNLYVSDYGTGSLYLLRPTTAVTNPEPSAVTINGVQLLEAEAAQLSGAVVKSDHVGASESAYADFINPSDDYIEWTVNVDTVGIGNAFFRYALGHQSNRVMELSVNGASIGWVEFTSTGTWSQWAYASLPIPMSAGSNTVRLTAIGDSGPNIDYLAINSVDTQAEGGAIAGGVNLEAEAANFAGAITLSGRGSSNDLFVDFQNPTNDFVEWTVDSDTADQRNIFIRYALGASQNRPLELTVNGSVVSTIDFSSTGSWEQWGTASVAITLASGSNTIRLTAIGDSGPNVDKMTIGTLQ